MFDAVVANDFEKEGKDNHENYNLFTWVIMKISSVFNKIIY